MSEAVSFPMTALPKGLAPARAKRKPGVLVRAGHGKFRLPSGQAPAPPPTSRLTAECGAGDTG